MVEETRYKTKGGWKLVILCTDVVKKKGEVTGKKMMEKAAKGCVGELISGEW